MSIISRIPQPESRIYVILAIFVILCAVYSIVVLPFDPDRMPAEQVRELATKALEEVVEIWARPSAMDNTRHIIRES